MTHDCHGIGERLHDWLDGALDAAERDSVRLHLEGCRACRDELAALESLREEAAGLPRELRPPRELWPAIESRLEPRRNALAWWRRLWTEAPVGAELWPPSPLLTAVVGLAALALGLWLWPAQPAPQTPVPTPMAAAARGLDPALAASADLARSEDGMLLAHRDLLEAVERQRDNLPPETVAILEENLRIIDEAIGEIRSALEDDPLNPRLQLLLAVHYQQEVQLLKRVSGV